MNMVLLDVKLYIVYFFWIKYFLKIEYINSVKWFFKLFFKNLYNLWLMMVINYKLFNIYVKIKVIISCIEGYVYKCLSIFLVFL